MSAPNHAVQFYDEPFIDEDGKPITITCQCGFKGGAHELLAVDPEEDQNLWCPQCRGMRWTYD